MYLIIITMAINYFISLILSCFFLCNAHEFGGILSPSQILLSGLQLHQVLESAIKKEK